MDSRNTTLSPGVAGDPSGVPGAIPLPPPFTLVFYRLFFPNPSLLGNILPLLTHASINVLPSWMPGLAVPC